MPAKVITSVSGLYIVATPIGNLNDMVPRAVDILQSVDLIAAEDTRHSAKLTNFYQIKTPMLPYHDHSNEKQFLHLLQLLEEGQSIALISDAGTPLISDPGYKLVKAAHEKGISVVPIPGACAFVTALSAAGIASDRFLFEGFLPSKAGAREKKLTKLKRMEVTLIFYEAPHRILELLVSIRSVFGEQRTMAIARELTKQYETILLGTVNQLYEQLINDVNQTRGEFVVMIEGAAEVVDLDESVENLLLQLMEKMPLKEAAAIVAQHTGIGKKQLYQHGLIFKQ